jgi:hypothetical protein
MLKIWTSESGQESWTDKRGSLGVCLIVIKKRGMIFHKKVCRLLLLIGSDKKNGIKKSGLRILYDILSMSKRIFGQNFITSYRAN